MHSLYFYEGLWFRTKGNVWAIKQKGIKILIWFTFLDKPGGARFTTNASQNTITEGDTVTFKCKVIAAVPQVSIYKFYFNGGLLSGNSNSKYALNNVNRSQHNGEYKCVPHNDTGDGAEATVILNMNGG